MVNDELDLNHSAGDRRWEFGMTEEFSSIKPEYRRRRISPESLISRYDVGIGEMMNDQNLRRAVRQVTLGNRASKLRGKDRAAVVGNAVADFSRVIGTGKGCKIRCQPSRHSQAAKTKLHDCATTALIE